MNASQVVTIIIGVPVLLWTILLTIGALLELLKTFKKGQP